MGNTASDEAGADGHHHRHQEGGDNVVDLDPFDGIDTLGYRVLGVQPNSPASRAGLVSFLDFIVGANGKMLLGSGEGLEEGDEYDDVDFPALLAESKGKAIELLVWNMKSQEERLVELVPADDWGGAGLLGVTIRLDNYAGAEERLIRVLEVEPDSKAPAKVAGLIPEDDFLLGTTHTTLDSTEALASILLEYRDTIMELYVYNAKSDLVRVVALMPTYSWGDGVGLLGAEVGTGYLHRFPKEACATDGSSVERKVRQVDSSQQQQKQQPGADGKDGSTTAAAAPKQTILELEPQLEMEPHEPSEDGDDDSSNNQHAGQRSSATADDNNGKKAATAKPPPPAAAVPSKEDNTTAAAGPKKVEDHNERQPLLQPPPVPVDGPYASPPLPARGTVSPAVSPSYLPPPPKIDVGRSDV